MYCGLLRPSTPKTVAITLKRVFERKVSKAWIHISFTCLAHRSWNIDSLSPQMCCSGLYMPYSFIKSLFRRYLHWFIMRHSNRIWEKPDFGFNIRILDNSNYLIGWFGFNVLKVLNRPNFIFFRYKESTNYVLTYILKRIVSELLKSPCTCIYLIFFLIYISFKTMYIWLVCVEKALHLRIWPYV